MLWMLLAVVTSLVVVTSVVSPQWLVGKPRTYGLRSERRNGSLERHRPTYSPTVGIFNRCTRLRRFGDFQGDSCATYVTGFNMPSGEFPDVWKSALIFFGVAIALLTLADIMAVFSLCVQSVFRKSIFTVSGLIQGIAGEAVAGSGLLYSSTCSVLRHKVRFFLLRNLFPTFLWGWCLMIHLHRCSSVVHSSPSFISPLTPSNLSYAFLSSSSLVLSFPLCLPFFLLPWLPFPLCLPLFLLPCTFIPLMPSFLPPPLTSIPLMPSSLPPPLYFHSPYAFLSSSSLVLPSPLCLPLFLLPCTFIPLMPSSLPPPLYFHSPYAFLSSSSLVLSFPLYAFLLPCTFILLMPSSLPPPLYFHSSYAFLSSSSLVLPFPLYTFLSSSSLVLSFPLCLPLFLLPYTFIPLTPSSLPPPLYFHSPCAFLSASSLVLLFPLCLPLFLLPCTFIPLINAFLSSSSLVLSFPLCLPLLTFIPHWCLPLFLLPCTFIPLMPSSLPPPLYFHSPYAFLSSSSLVLIPLCLPLFLLPCTFIPLMPSSLPPPLYFHSPYAFLSSSSLVLSFPLCLPLFLLPCTFIPLMPSSLPPPLYFNSPYAFLSSSSLVLSFPLCLPLFLLPCTFIPLCLPLFLLPCTFIPLMPSSLPPPLYFHSPYAFLSSSSLVLSFPLYAFLSSSSLVLSFPLCLPLFLLPCTFIPLMPSSLPPPLYLFPLPKVLPTECSFLRTTCLHQLLEPPFLDFCWDFSYVRCHLILSFRIFLCFDSN